MLKVDGQTNRHYSAPITKSLLTLTLAGLIKGLAMIIVTLMGA